MIMPGFVWGKVEDNKDPLGLGRVKVSVPGVFNSPKTHPEWAIPAGWPGAGAPQQGWGSYYPVRLESNVLLLFEAGDVMSTPAYLPVISGTSDGAALGPVAATEAEDPRTRAVIWEDDRLQVYCTTGTDTNQNVDDRRMEIRDKLTGNGITFNVTDGAQGKSSTITLDANTSINIVSKGVVNISGASVQIQGRKVVRKPGTTSI